MKMMSLLWGTIILTAIVGFWVVHWVVTSTVVLTIGLLLWIWFGTFYIIEGDRLKYFLGPFRGNIPIQSIKKVTLHSYSFIGMRAVLSFDGLKINYNNFDEVWISPYQEVEFINELVKVNPEIIKATN